MNQTNWTYYNALIENQSALLLSDIRTRRQLDCWLKSERRFINWKV